MESHKLHKRSHFGGLLVARFDQGIIPSDGADIFHGADAEFRAENLVVLGEREGHPE